ncbi:hypothetical protein CUMW_257590, partial [Citrus unshiu]
MFDLTGSDKGGVHRTKSAAAKIDVHWNGNMKTWHDIPMNELKPPWTKHTSPPIVMLRDVKGLQAEEVLPQMMVLSIEEIEKQSIEVAIKKLGAGIMGYRNLRCTLTLGS